MILISSEFLFPYTCPVIFVFESQLIRLLRGNEDHVIYHVILWLSLFVNKEEPLMPNLLQFSMDSCFQGRVEHLRDLRHIQQASLANAIDIREIGPEEKNMFDH